MSKLTEKVGKKISFYRKKKKLDQTKLADSVGLKCKQTISHYETRKHSPSLDKLNDIAVALKVKLKDLLP